MSVSRRHPFQQLSFSSLSSSGMTPLPSTHSQSHYSDVHIPFDVPLDVDLSFLDPFDFDLLHDPLDSFRDMCWSAAIHDEPEDEALDGCITPTQVLSQYQAHQPRLLGLQIPISLAVDEDEDDESFSSEDPSTPVFDKTWLPDYYDENLSLTGSMDSLSNLKSSLPFIDHLDSYGHECPWSQEDLRSFMLLDQPVKIANPTDTVAGFPIQGQEPRYRNSSRLDGLFPTKLVRFCSTLPRRVRSSSP